MHETITLRFPASPDPASLEALRTELLSLGEVTKTGSATTRSIGPAEVAMWVGLVADAVAVATVASGTLKKIMDRVRARQIRGAVVELPNGVRISIDSASEDQILSLVSAWRREEAR